MIKRGNQGGGDLRGYIVQLGRVMKEVTLEFLEPQEEAISMLVRPS